LARLGLKIEGEEGAVEPGLGGEEAACGNDAPRLVEENYPPAEESPSIEPERVLGPRPCGREGVGGSGNPHEERLAGPDGRRRGEGEGGEALSLRGGEKGREAEKGGHEEKRFMMRSHCF